MRPSRGSTGWTGSDRPACWRRSATVTGFLILATTCGVAGCDPVRGALTVRNETATSLDIRHGDAVIQTVRPDGRQQITLGDAGECLDWHLDAVAEDGTVVDSLEAPICDEDVWTVGTGSDEPGPVFPTTTVG
jgi:hypothetical protein